MILKRLFLILAVASALCVGCKDPNVVAEVGDAKLLRGDLESFAASQSHMAPDARALDALLERELLAEGARERGLADDPKVRVRLAAARREVLAQALLERTLDKAPSDDELKARYELRKDALSKRVVHVQHIALRLDPAADAAARVAAQAKSNAVYSRLLSGEPFDAVALESSEDAVTAKKGGDLGELREGQVDQTFFEHAVALKKGELSKPFQSPFGTHLVRAMEDPTTYVPPFDEVRGRLVADARREREAKLLEELKAGIAVKRYPERLAQARRGADAGEDSP